MSGHHYSYGCALFFPGITPPTAVVPARTKYT
jgi:hypothetical protein